MGSRNVRSAYIEIISNNNHWCITASSLTFHLDDCELSIFSCLAGFNTSKVFANGVQDFRGTPKLARRGGADLDEMLANGFPEPNCIDKDNPKHSFTTYLLNMV